MTSLEAYQQAYQAHYKYKKYDEALNKYLLTIKLFPESNEARYAKQQLENLKALIDFESIVVDDAVIDTFSAYVEQVHGNEEQKQLAKAEMERLAEEKKLKAEEKLQRILKAGDIPVTTADINNPYEIIGPIIVNTTNKGIFNSAYSQLLKKYSTYPMSALLKMPSTMSEQSGEVGTFLLSIFDTSLGFEGSVGQASFDSAYYICVAELKLRCAEMGGDAVVGMHMDFDLDTNNWAGFYIQMHGTAVKLKKD
jgi:uncharacterized protein YbjQ (UPF0145 family)